MKKTALIIFIILSLLSSLQAQETQSYTLDTCKKLALTNNAKVKNAALEIKSAEQTKKAAFTKYFPSVSAMGNAFQSDQSLVDVNLSDVDVNISFEDQRLNDILQTLYSDYGAYLPKASVNFQMMEKGLLGGVTAIQPVFAGGRIVKGNQLANLGIKAANYQYDIAKDELLMHTEQSYWLIVSLQEKLKTVEMAEKLLDTLYKDANGAYQSGIVLQNDLMKVKLKQNELSSNRLKVENGITLAKMALCQYIGIAYSEQFRLSDSIENLIAPWKYKTSHEAAVVNRPEYKLLNLSVEAEHLKKQMLIGETLPQVGVGAAYLYNNLMGKNNINSLVFATVKVPITGWWEASHNIKKQEIQEEVTQNNRNDLSEMLLLQMQQSWNEVDEAYRQVQLAEESIKDAKENLKKSNDYYLAGMCTVSDVLQSQTLLQQSCDQYTDFRIQYKIKLANYLQMTQ